MLGPNLEHEIEHFSQLRLTSYTKFYEIVRSYMSFALDNNSQGWNVNFCVASWNRLLVSFWTFFKYLGNHSELENTETTKKIFVDAGIFLK